MLLYKLTDKDCCTYNGTRWGVNVTHEVTGEGELCGPGWIHAYTDPLLAVLLNPIHADFTNQRLWEAEGEIGKDDCGLKVGCKKLTTIREIPLPEISTEQKFRFAILCALEVFTEPSFVKWANNWLENKDRSSSAAEGAWSSVSCAVWSVAFSAARSAARSAKSVDLKKLAKQVMECEEGR